MGKEVREKRRGFVASPRVFAPAFRVTLPRKFKGVSHKYTQLST